MFTPSLAALVGAFYATNQPQAAMAIELLCLLTCTYTVITVPLLTPKDWPQILPRVIAGALILSGLAMW